jgi:uncharacterized protein YggE
MHHLERFPFALRASRAHYVLRVHCGDYVVLKSAVRFGVAMVATLIAVPVAAQEPNPQSGPQTPTIITVGEATIRRAPDQAFITVAVETRARAPRDAQKQNADAMAAVQLRLADAGIPKDGVRTTGYSIQQEFDFTNGRRVPRDYTARNGVEIRVDAVERVGEILDAVVQAGATSVTGVRFDVKDRTALERDALTHAVEDARARADALAAGAGRTIDRVIRIDDSRQPRIGPQPVMMMRAAADSAQTTPIEAGLIEIHAQVTLTLSLK